LELQFYSELNFWSPTDLCEGLTTTYW